MMGNEGSPFDTGSGGGFQAGAFEAGLDEFEVDLSEQYADLPPPGVAILQVVDVRKGKSRAGNAQWIWSLRPVSYLEPANLRDLDCAELQNIDYFTATTRRALWKVDEIMRALGVAKSEDGRHRFKREDVLGVCMKAALKEGEFNGRKQTNIEALAPHPDGAGYKMALPTMPEAGADGGTDIPF